MKIYILYRNYKPIHANFKVLVANPPEGIEYTLPPVNNKINRLYFIHRRFGQTKVVKAVYGLVKNYLFRTKNRDLSQYNLVHIVDHIPSDYKNYNYVVDIGHITSLAGYYAIDDKSAAKILEFLLHENCKKILARSNAAAKSIEACLKLFCDKASLRELMLKVILVYPAAQPDKRERKKIVEEVRLLHVGNGVFNKGVHEEIEAYWELKKKYKNISLTVVASDYDKLPKKYRDTTINFESGGLSREQAINKYFTNHDLLLLPSHHEIFGMVFLDAFSAKMPAIAINQFSTPEIVIDGFSGFLIDSDRTPFDRVANLDKKDVKVSQFYEPEERVVKQLVKTVEKFIHDPKLATRLGKNAVSLVKEGGKFAINTRNKQLKDIYEQAIR